MYILRGGPQACLYIFQARAAFSVERVLFCELGLASDESPLDENSYVFSEASSTWLPFLLNSRRSRARMSVAAATASCATVEDLLGAHENHQQALDRPPKAPSYLHLS